ncbi:MAG: MFS transporter [Anaeroplasma sp.]|uniref:MFS transporter n=1 Tax=Anaeroplasma sp. TaxID=1872523 RepID=UPI002A9164D0|nr:MFS transporter [Anaeroplasma sp.]MDY5983698.1 MFS transporter [Anaeroplasma sp.]
MRSYPRYITIVITSLFIGILTNLGHPVTPYLVKARGFIEYSFSIFFSVMSLGMLIFAPLWGSFGDKYGRRIVLLICSIGYSIGQVFFGFLDNIYLVICARFFSGCFSAGLMVSVISFLDTSRGLKGFDMKRLIPMVLSFNLVGSSLGSYIGGVLGDTLGGNLNSYQWVLYIQAISLSIFGLILFFFFRLTDEELYNENQKRSNFIKNIKNVSKIGLWSIIFLICLTLFNVVFTNMQRYLDYYYADIGKTSSELGLFNLIIGIATLITNILITPILLKKLKSIVSIILFAILGTISIVITFAINKDYLIYMIYTVLMVYIMSKAIIESGSVSFIQENIKIAPGLIMGVRQSFMSLGAVVGPLAGGAIYYSLPVDERRILFFICALLYLLAAIILFGIYILRNRFKSNPLGGDIFCESVD